MHAIATTNAAWQAIALCTSQLPASGKNPLIPDTHWARLMFVQCIIATTRSFSYASGFNDDRNYTNHGSDTRRTLWAEAEAFEDQQVSATGHEEADIEKPKASVRRLKRRTRVNRVTEALGSQRLRTVLPASHRSKIDRSHFNVKQSDAFRHHSRKVVQHESDFIPNLSQTRELSLERILASYIDHRSPAGENRTTAWQAPFYPTRAEAALLQSKGYDLEDLSVWAEILTSSGSLSAAQTLVDRVSSRSASSIPLFVLLYLLRRPYISAPALRIITNQAWTILGHRTSKVVTKKIPPNAVTLIFIRLIRHARDVWPSAMENITAMLLHYLPKVIADGKELTSSQLKTLTFILNKAMRLIAIRTARQPFQNHHFQELSIVSILSFMADHEPSLQTNREGYRAVVSVQLRSAKTKKERQWAELKSLSWPPWKQDRTAMDSDITPDYHGVSKARETLLRMQEAGYPHQDWEKVASIYAGWDVDGTPTIQTRVIFEAGAASLKSGTAAWTARIHTTRTAQEAWACYLAYEDSELPPDQNVYLSIFQKLHQEERRKKQASASSANADPDMLHEWLPGDRAEVKPLPPSVHLHTYTRTPPPTMNGLYKTLRERGIVFNGHCLAFLIANATSLQIGLEYLSHSLSAYPQLAEILDPNLPYDSSISMPMPIFEAIIGLFTRFPNDLPQLTSTDTLQRQGRSVSALSLDGQKLNSNNALVRAFELVSQRCPTDLRSWNIILTALAREIPLLNLYSAPGMDAPSKAKSQVGKEDPSHHAIVSYRLVNKLLVSMRHTRLDLDVNGFRALCQATENMVVSCWKTLKHRPMPGYSTTPPHIRQAVDALQKSERHTKRLTFAFRELVGSDTVIRLQSGNNEVELFDASQVPSALERLGTSTLHVYVRALGWLADYDSILETVQWMVKYQEDLNENFKVDDLGYGEVKTRKLMTAIRLFLERSWLSPTADEAAGDEPGSGERRDAREASLKQIRQPADADVIEEVRQLVESVEEWGGWPEDEEVEEYCKHQRFDDTR